MQNKNTPVSQECIATHVEIGTAIAAAEPLKSSREHYWKYPATPENDDRQKAVRRERYELLKWAVDVAGDDPSHTWAVTGCRSCLQYGVERVRIVHSEKRASSYLGGLQSCGSPHICPVCSGHIADRRVEQIGAILKAHREDGGRALMGSLTLSHTAEMSLVDIPLEGGGSIPGTMTQLHMAWRSMVDSRAYKELLSWAGYEGLIRADETMFGGYNGEHPHMHVVWCLADNTGLSTEELRAEFERRLRPIWRHELERAGASCDLVVGCVVTDASMSDGEYLEKFKRARGWGTQQEVARGKSKRGRRGSLSAFDLLRCVAGERHEYTPEAAREAFLAYAHATKGLASVYISHNLLEKYEVPNLSDMELLAQQEQGTVLLELDEEQWGVIEPAKVELMEVADSGRRDLVVAWLRARGVPVILPLELPALTGPPVMTDAEKRRLAWGIEQLGGYDRRYDGLLGDAWMRFGDEGAF